MLTPVLAIVTASFQVQFVISEQNYVISIPFRMIGRHNNLANTFHLASLVNEFKKGTFDYILLKSVA